MFYSFWSISIPACSMFYSIAGRMAGSESTPCINRSLLFLRNLQQILFFVNLYPKFEPLICVGCFAFIFAAVVQLLLI